MADNIFWGFSNARCLDLMCGASSQLRSRNSNTSLDKEGNAIRAVVLFTVVYQQKSTRLDLFRWKHIFPTRIAIWKVYPIFRQTHTHTHTHIMNRRCIESAFDMQWSHLNGATFGTLAGLHSGFFNGGLDCIKANIVGGKIGRIDYSDLFRRFQIWFQHPGFWSIMFQRHCRSLKGDCCINCTCRSRVGDPDGSGMRWEFLEEMATVPAFRSAPTGYESQMECRVVGPGFQPRKTYQGAKPFNIFQLDVDSEIFISPVSCHFFFFCSKTWRIRCHLAASTQNSHGQI